MEKGVKIENYMPVIEIIVNIAKVVYTIGSAVIALNDCYTDSKNEKGKK
jgi:hypothetical protein